MTIEKKGATPFENAPHGATAQADSTTTAPERETTRPLFHALTWRGTPAVQDGDQAQILAEKTTDPLLGWHALAAPAKAKMRGKHKRNARRDALAAKRHQGGFTDFEMIVITAWAVLLGLFVVGEAIGRALQ